MVSPIPNYWFRILTILNWSEGGFFALFITLYYQKNLIGWKISANSEFVNGEIMLNNELSYIYYLWALIFEWVHIRVLNIFLNINEACLKTFAKYFKRIALECLKHWISMGNNYRFLVKRFSQCNSVAAEKKPLPLITKK